MIASVREAAPGDADDVERLLDAAMLEFDRERVRTRIDRGSALVAVVADGGAGDGGESDAARDGESDAVWGSGRAGERVVGACVFGDVVGDVPGIGADASAAEIEQIAVHRSRRGRGIGRALVEAVDGRTDGPLVAQFHESVRPFYEALGFEIRDGESEARLVGVRA